MHSTTAVLAPGGAQLAAGTAYLACMVCRFEQCPETYRGLLTASGNGEYFDIALDNCPCFCDVGAPALWLPLTNNYVHGCVTLCGTEANGCDPNYCHCDCHETPHVSWLAEWEG
jgi:hypothetical protein